MRPPPLPAIPSATGSAGPASASSAEDDSAVPSWGVPDSSASGDPWDPPSGHLDFRTRLNSPKRHFLEPSARGSVTHSSHNGDPGSGSIPLGNTNGGFYGRNHSRLHDP